MNWLKEPYLAVSGTATGTTDWADSGSSKVVPVSARECEVLVACATAGASTGSTYIDGRAGGAIVRLWQLLTGAEENDGSCCRGRVPVVQGRFDYRFVFGGGVTGVTHAVYILGYE